MTTWLLVAVLALGSLALKVVGPLLAGGRRPPKPLTRVIALLTPALITALVVADTFLGDDDTPTLDARAAGVLAGVVVLWFRRSPVVALVVAAGLAALVRAVS